MSQSVGQQTHQTENSGIVFIQFSFQQQLSIMSTKRKNGGHTNSDFKRLKAKVGKRAPKSANVTDTSFRAASLHVAGQSIDRSKESAAMLLSTRGKSMFDLTAQLGHPAAAVRLSAIKGLGDIARSQAPYMLRAHLSTLVPTCAKSWVDEDDEVRTVGLSAFGDLLGKQNDLSIRPFVLLIVSYVTSALHSLDARMRVDGARAVNLVSTLHPRLLVPFVAKLLHPFLGLLTDRNKLKSNEDILRSLTSLLELSTDESTQQDVSETTDGDPDLSFVPGGRARNAIILGNRSFRDPIAPFHPFQQLQPSEYLQSLDTQSYPNSSLGHGMDDELIITHDLLEKLRDILVEATEEENTDYTIGKKTSTGQNKEKLLLFVVKAIGLLWKRKKQLYSKSNDCDTVKLDKLAIQIVADLLDLFPIRQGDIKSIDNTSAQNLNSAICITVMEIASSVDICRDPGGTTLDWMPRLSAFLQPQLRHYKVDMNYSQSSFNVFCDLLLLSNTSTDFQFSMLQQMQKVFFGDEDIQLARSPAGRKAVLVFGKLMKQLEYGGNAGSSSWMDLLKTIILRIQSYVNAWESEFWFETNQALGLLYDIVRSNSADNVLVQQLREGMAPMLATDKRKTGKGKQSTFELYCLPTQRKLLSLLAILETPSVETLKGLASICARSTGGNGMSDEIVATVTSIRRTIPMKNYLQFLLSQIGSPTTSTRKAELENEPFDSFMQRLLHLDSAVGRSSIALIQCGSARVLPMLYLHLSGLLDSTLDIGSYNCFLRNRAALATLAMLALDIENTTSTFAIPPQLEQAVKSSIFEAIFFVSSSSDASAAGAKLLSPILALFQIDKMLVVSLFDDVVDKIGKFKSSKQLQQKMIQVLIDVVVDHRTTETLSGLGQLHCCVQSLELSLREDAGPSMVDLLGHLKAVIEIRVGKETEA